VGKLHYYVEQIFEIAILPVICKVYGLLAK